MKKETIKKALLLIPIAFYAYITIISIEAAINGVNPYGSTYYGMTAFREVFTDRTIQALFDGEPIGLCFMFSTLYIVYFIASYKKEPGEKDINISLEGNKTKEKESSSENNKPKTKVSVSENNMIRTEKSSVNAVKRVLYDISRLILVIFFLGAVNAGINGFNAGWFGSVRMEYGMEAFCDFIVMYGLYFTVIPVLPCSILYIVVYLAKSDNKEK